MINSKQIISESKKLLNVPFCHYGRSVIGLDCAGLIWLIHNRLGLNYPRVDYHYGPMWWRDRSQGERLLEGFLKSEFEFYDNPVVGGIVLFRLYGKNVAINHCGIVINEDEFIHAKCGCGARINKVTIDYLKPNYIKRCAGYMINKKVEYMN